MTVYVDSSALVKLVVTEAETLGLRRFLRSRPQRASSVLARVEVPRAVRAHGMAAMARARALMRGLDLVPIDEPLLDVAAELDPRVLRSLDAIHLASALRFATDLEAVVTYDVRMADAARLLGLRVEAPRSDTRSR